MPENYLAQLESLAPALSSVFRSHGMDNAAVSISRCTRFHRCRNRLCFTCQHLRACLQRRHLKQQIRRLHTVLRHPVVWAITPKVLDSTHHHRQRIQELVTGVRCFIRQLPITQWFAAVETAHSALGDDSHNAHAHGLVVFDTSASGRGYVPLHEWESRIDETWQLACPEIAQDCYPERLCTLADGLNWSCYSTKMASVDECFSQALVALDHPGHFMEQTEAQRGLPRFMGTMSASRRRTAISRRLT
jgi:hypothetical protein